MKGLSHSATVYYVATNGDDSNPGSEGQPWRTIQKAADTLIAGDTVYIKAGVYNERVIVQNSGGAAEGYITQKYLSRVMGRGGKMSPLP